MAKAHVSLLDEEISLLKALKAAVEKNAVHAEVKKAWTTSLDNHIKANEEYRDASDQQRRQWVDDEIAALKEMKKPLAAHSKTPFGRCWLQNIEGDEKILEHLK